MTCCKPCRQSGAVSAKSAHRRVVSSTEYAGRAALVGYSLLAIPVNVGSRVIKPALSASAKIARSEEHTSELQSLMRISYAVFCLKKKKKQTKTQKRPISTNR